MQRRTWVALAALAASTIATPVALAQAKEIKIAHVYSRTGPLEAYGKQTQTGLMMGLDYATGGNKLAAARLLGISRAKLYERLGTMPEIQSMSEIWTAHTASFPDSASPI